MLSYFLSASREEAFVCNADNYIGYYAAVGLQESRQFQRVVAGVCSRDDEYSRDLQKRGIELREWNLNDRHSVEQALKGISNIVITIEPSNEVKQHTETIIEACKSAQVRSVVFWSTIGLEHANEEQYKHLHQLAEIEEMIKRGGFQNMCITRIGFPQQLMFLLSHRIQDRGQLPLPTARGKFAPVSLKDCAMATAKLLSNAGESGGGNKHCYQFTGKRLVTGQKLVEHANRVLEAEIDYQDVNMDEFRQILKQEAEELNEFALECIVEKMQLIKENKLAVRTDDLEKIMGRKPMDLETFFRENARDFKPSGGQIRRLCIHDTAV